MWHDIIKHLLAYFIGLGLLVWITGSKPLGFRLLWAFTFALALSVPLAVFEYFPELDKGWVSLAVVAVIALAVSFPFSCLARRLMRKKRTFNNSTYDKSANYTPCKAGNSLLPVVFLWRNGYEFSDILLLSRPVPIFVGLYRTRNRFGYHYRFAVERT